MLQERYSWMNVVAFKHKIWDKTFAERRSRKKSDMYIISC